MTEREKMLAGLLYNAGDPELAGARRRAHRLAAQINRLEGEDPETLAPLFRELLGRTGERLVIEPPFRCDYGRNIVVGEDFYANFDCVLLDVCPITLGDRVMLGPGVRLYTAYHPTDAAGRAAGREMGAPITVGNDVWIGGSAILLPGVTIGDRTVIGAGSVVTRDLPADVLAAGNPCRVLRPSGAADRDRCLALCAQVDTRG